MIRRPRCVALGLTLLLTATAVGQDAPTPAELLKEYQALGLPLPPATARLVRFKDGMGGFVLWEYRAPDEGLAFEVRPGTMVEPPVLFRKTAEWQPDWNPRAREVKPDAAAARGVPLSPDELLALAVQCHARGWDDLARTLLARLCDADGGTDPRKQLLGLAWRHWEGQLTHPTADRRPAAARLKALIRRDPEFDTERNHALLRSLGLALVPGTGRPGTVEALIDALVDYHTDPTSLWTSVDSVTFLRITERGFDAAPALIAHLDDERLTRSRVPHFNNFPPRDLRVGDLAGLLLEGLAGGELDRTPDGDDVGWLRLSQGYRVTRAAATAWWEKARKTGEEAHLLARVLPPGDVEEGRVNLHLLRVLAAKYPGRLPELYRTVLARRPVIESWELAEALARSAVPAKDKLDLFTTAAGHEDYVHRRPALGAIKDLDRKRFDALVLAEVEALPAEVQGEFWRSRQARLGVTWLATQSDDPRVWAALEKAARRSVAAQRGRILTALGDPRRSDHRAERLRLLTGFLDDPAVYVDRVVQGEDEWIEVRNAVSLQVGWLLRLDIEPGPRRTPAEWSAVRDEVRAAARRELDRVK